MTSAFKAGALALSILGAGLLGTAAASASPASPAIGLFAQNAALANEFEIESAKIILEDSTDPAVRSFAQQMLADHGKAQALLDRAGAEAGVDTRIVMDAARQKMIDDIGLMDSPKLDQTYLAEQVDAHAEAVAMLSDYAASGEDPALVAYARMALPVVLRHQQMLQRLAGIPAAQS